MSAKRADAVAVRSIECADVCRAVLQSTTSVAPKRVALDALVRHATQRGARRPGDVLSVGVAAADRHGLPAGDRIEYEHIVPVRVLVDRMLGGDDAGAVLAVAVMAFVLRSEHRDIGPLVTVHKDLYAEMLAPSTPLDRLPELGRRRYEDRGIRFAPE